MSTQKKATTEQLSALIEYADKSSPLTSTDLEALIARQRLQKTRPFHPNDRLKKCGVVNHSPVTLHKVGNRIYISGLTTCGNPHLCPVCSRKIINRRRYELTHGLNQAWSMGKSLVLETFSLPHRLGDPLKGQLDALQACWSAASSAKAGSKTKSKYGVYGYYKVLEIKYSHLTGWNVHLHILWILNSPLPESDLAEFGAAMFHRWAGKAVKLGFQTPNADGHDIRPVKQTEADFLRVGSYILKDSISGSTKRQSQNDSLTMNDLLNERLNATNFQYVNAWKEYEKATYRRNRTQWSQGLKGKLGINELSDKQIIDEPMFLAITAESLGKFKSDVHVQARIMKSLKDGGIDEAAWFLNLNGIDFHIVENE